MTYREIICLANSARSGGYCFAGQDLDTGKWVRPISIEGDHSISLAQQSFRDGGSPSLLDIVKIPLAGQSIITSAPYQTENYELADGYWEHVGRLSHGDLSKLKISEAELWHCSISSKLDRIHRNSYEVFQDSLRLVKVPRLKILKKSRYKFKACFKYRGIDYCLSVTDPKFSEKYKAIKGGEQIEINEPVLLSVSLAEPFKGFAYKLIAGVIYCGT